MTIKFKSFKNQIADLCRSELQADLEDLTNVSSADLRTAYSKGQTPEEFFEERLASSPERPLDAYTDDEFDPRWEL